MAGFMQNLQDRKVSKSMMHEVEKPDSDLTVQAALARGAENGRVIQSCTLHCESQNLDLPVDKNDFLKVSTNGLMDVVNTNGPNDMVNIDKHGDLKSNSILITMCGECSDLKESFTASVPLISRLRPVEDRLLQTAAYGASSQFEPSTCSQSARGGAAICNKNRWNQSSQQIFVRPRWHFLHSPIEGVVLMNDRAKWSLKDPDVVHQNTLTSLNFLLTSSLEEGCYNTTIATAHLLTSQCPSEQMIWCLVSILKEAKEESTLNAAYSLLMTWLKQHPPIDSDIRILYEKGLKLYDWDSVQEIIELSVDTAAGETEQLLASWGGARLHLKFLLATLECNFLHFLHNINKQGACNCLLIRCLWAPSYQICCNPRIRRLLTFLQRSLKAFKSAQACWEEILGLLAMVAQCCHLADNNWQWGEAVCSGGVSTTYFVQELAASVSVCDRQILQLVLSRIPAPWLRGQLSAALLSNYDDYLVPGGLLSDQWSLAKIVSQFFYLLPNMSHTSDSEFTRKKTAETDIVDPDVSTSLAGQRLTADRINKRNPKGETLLHRAAIKNDVVLLKQMLSVPGVDVNAQDNAGWSPLHEACHHGNVECVRALLKFVPKKTIDAYTSGAGKLKRVDIRALSEEKITPLHDAVLKNHVSVVTLLLQYGGTSLLQARTVLGNTPLDLARTEEMRQVLTSAKSVDT
ncbi:uncharacterized protein LOC112574436 [Pomacea canaliculata]|uniref:uncharacterized protein LOC112574436 n=1 Tax=Pomacea canaliculata TaxID=400727 RepID=UPI000D738639|nr:uncharacterized protein LOC112574436 [Pomacea canaliculata]